MGDLWNDSDDDETYQYSGEEGDDNEEVVEDDEMEVSAPDEGADIADLFDSEIAMICLFLNDFI